MNKNPLCDTARNTSNRTKYAILLSAMFLFVTCFTLLAVSVGADDSSSSKISTLSGDMPVMAGSSSAHPYLDRDSVKQKMTSIEIPFIQNVGQIENPAVQYYVDTFAGRVFVTDDGITYALGNSDKSYAIKEFALGKEYVPISFQTVTGTQKSVTNVSSFTGDNPDKWQSHIPAYGGVSLGDVWNGIDISLYAYGNNVEKIFTVMPGYDSSIIKLSYDGVSDIRIDENGNLVLYSVESDDTSIMSMSAPVAYQEINGKKTSVQVNYKIIDNATYGFSVGDYNKNYPLVIDPLLQSTYIGGTGGDYGYIILHDGFNSVYVVGDVASDPFPGTSGGARDFNAGSCDLTVTKLNEELTTVIQSTYVGGSGCEEFPYMALDSSGNVFIGSRTPSNDNPGTTGGAVDSYQGGTYDSIVFKLSNDLTELIQSTYIGGTDFEFLAGLAIDSSDNVFIFGRTQSVDYNSTFVPLSLEPPAQSSHQGSSDFFITKLTNDLTSVIQSTYLGTSANDIDATMALDSSDNVFVAGRTTAGTAPFPGISGGAQTTITGGIDVIVSKLNNDLTSVIQSTYLGSPGEDVTRGLNIDGNDNVFVVGHTTSDGFTGVSGGAQTSVAGGSDFFIAKLNNDLTSNLQSTYLGGSGDDNAVNTSLPIAFDSVNNVYVGGKTTSTDLPGTTGGIQEDYGGNGDLFVSKLNNDLTRNLQSTYLGGPGYEDSLLGMTFDKYNLLYVSGTAEAAGFPGTDGGAQPDHAGDADLFIAKFSSLFVAGGEGGNGCADCTPPTLGIDSRGIQMVDGGFTFNDNTVDVQYYYTPYPLLTVNIGENNTAEFKIYDDGGPDNIRHFEFAYGMDKGQYMSQSNARIEYDIDFQGNRTITIIDPENAIDDDSVKIETDTVPCKADASYDCLLVKIHHIFRAPLGFDIVGTNVWDEDNNSMQNYYNHGIRVEGESLNPPKEIMLPLDLMQNHPARQAASSTVKLLQIDVVSDLWIDKWGYVWQGDESRMKLLSEIPFVRYSDADNDNGISKYSDRNHSEFSNAVLEQQVVSAEIYEAMYGSVTNNAAANSLDDNYDDNNRFSFADELAYVKHLQIREELAELKTKYNMLNSEHTAKEHLESVYPYMYSDRINNSFPDSAVDDDDLLQSLKERISVLDVLINWQDDTQ